MLDLVFLANFPQKTQNLALFGVSRRKTPLVTFLARVGAGSGRKAKKGKLSKSQTGEFNWIPVYIVGALILAILNGLMETSYSEYMKKLGINTAELIVSQPSFGEQALDMTDTLIRSNALDLIIIDSAPTGETLTLLSLPQVMKSWITKAFPGQRLAIKTLGRVVRGTRTCALAIPRTSRLGGSLARRAPPSLAGTHASGGSERRAPRFRTHARNRLRRHSGSPYRCSRHS